jgi:hypothetical protein
MSGAAAIVDRAALYVFLCLFVLAVFISLHQAAIFLRVVEDTSAGVDEIIWPKEPWIDFIGKWFFLVWVAGVSAGLWGILLLPVGRFVPAAVIVIAVLLLGWFTFPIALLSTMAASSAWVIIHPLLLWRLAQKPLLIGFIYANGLLVLLPCALLGYGVIGEFHLILMPFMAPIWVIALLCYGRVLGRVGFELMQEDRGG